MKALTNGTMESGREMAKRKLLSGAFEGTVSKFSNSGHVICPKDWIGKRVKVEVIEEEESMQN